jgi:tetratricopeptide (TPR) repeat protein
MSELPQRLGEFEILREIGRGGMGVVYEAVQHSLGRKVALKVLHSAPGLTGRAVERFHREASAAAKLHHTNIVPVYAIGEQDGTHFYAMELIEGPSLDQVIRRLRDPAATSLPDDLLATGPYLGLSTPAPEATPGLSSKDRAVYFDTVARLIGDVADALEHAHREGVLHRDVKPANLLLSPDGRLSLNDFGLARLVEQPGLTVTGEMVGTPAYVSPEQITGGRVPIDHRTDVYSLGATLYELLTLRPPFVAERRDQLLAGVLQKEPTPPRSLNPAVPRDLETICLKALEKDPDRRYRTAGALADDLRRYVARFAIAARRVGPIGRLAKWARRHRALAWALAGLLAALLTAGLFAYQSHVAHQRLRETERQAALDRAMTAAMDGQFKEAEDAIADAERLQATAGQVRLREGLLAFQRRNLPEAIRHLKQAVRLMPDSVAARALLGLAHIEHGNLGEAWEVDHAELARLTPTTPEDLVFLGQFESFIDPPRALATLDRAIQRRDSLMARLARAEARVQVAYDLGSAVMAEKSLADVAAGRGMLADSPNVLIASLDAHLALLAAYQSAGNSDKAQNALAQAGMDVRALVLRGEPLTARTLWCRLTYLDQAGKHKEALELARDACKTPDVSFQFRTQYSLRLCLAGDLKEAEKALSQKAPPDNKMYYHILRAILFWDTPEGEAKVLDEYKRLGPLSSNTNLDFYPQMILRILGGKHLAKGRQLCEDLRPQVKHWPPNRRDWCASLLDYNASPGGPAAIQELVKAAGDSRWNQCEGHYFIGVTLLGEGDREGARKHFEAALASRVFTFNEYYWSRMFLARLGPRKR